MNEKIVITTTNKNKVGRIQKLLKNANFEVVGLSEIVKGKIEEPEETAESGIDNAIEKAIYFYL